MYAFSKTLSIVSVLTLSTVFSSCSLFSSEDELTPEQQMFKRINAHADSLHTDINAVKNEDLGKAGAADAKYCAKAFSDMGYAVSFQQSAPDNEAANAYYGQNVIVFKPGLYPNDEALIIGADYLSGSAVHLLEVANKLKDIPINHNIYFVIYNRLTRIYQGRAINHAGSYMHAKKLCETLGKEKVMGVIMLGDKHYRTSESDNVQLIATARGKNLAASCSVPFIKTYGPTPIKQLSTGFTHAASYDAYGIPVVYCMNLNPINNANTGKYIQALTDMIHVVADTVH